ncbi:MAG TPA: hemagglutinin repeat-containing protein [Selenomonadales bacterium]|nr:hemagglutinin repeat-containing protein [Selenomonadales bacterium]
MGTDALFGTQRNGFRKFIAWTTLVLFLAQPALAAAAPAADPSAPAGQKPVIDKAQNGVPVVQIAAPSKAGVSHNKYLQFNIDPNGLILNNSRVVTPTQLAGYITGNPNLAGGPARIILNEVTGRDISRLGGYLEVAGPKADVVIANPNGIVGSGFGFINTNRAVLTTGTPIFGGSGSLEAFRVTGGTIAVEGDGLNANGADRVDLIARAVEVNAGLWAKEINAVTGANEVDYNTLKAQKIAGDANQPAVSLDVAALGGMYAGKITLVGTEQGVGVNNAGTIAASGGDLVLTQEGKIVNSGTIAGAKNTALSAGTIASTGTLAAGVTSDGSVGNAGDLTLSAAGAVSATGKNLAGGNLAMTGATLDLSGAATYAGNDATITAAGGDVNHTGAALQAGGSLSLNAAGSVDNQGGSLVQLGSAATRITAAGAIDNTGGTIATNGDSLTVTAGSLANTQGQIRHAGTGALTVRTAGDLKNVIGAIAGNGQVNLAGRSIDNTQGTVGGQGAVSVTGETLTNVQGAIAGQDAVTVTATGDIDNRSGMIGGDGDVAVTAQGTLGNGQGTLQAGRDLALGAKTLANSAGKVQANGNLTVAAQNIDNTGGTLSAQQDLTIQPGAASLDNAGGTATAGNNLTVRAATIHNAGGTLAARQDAALSAQRLTGAGTVSAGRDLGVAISGDYTHAADAVLEANNNLNLTVTGSITNQGSLTAVHNATVDGANIANQTGATIAAGAELTVNAGGSLANQGGLTGDALTLNARNVNNTGAIMGDSLTVNADSISNSGATAVMATTGDTRLYARTGLTNSDGALIHSEGDILIAGGEDAGSDPIRSGSVLNQSSTIEATGDIGIYADQITNKQVYTVRETSPVKVSDITYYEIYTWEAGGNGDSGGVLWYDYIYAPPGSPGRITSKDVDGYTIFLLSEVVTETNSIVDQSFPAGQILAGRDMTLRADTVTNDAGNILAGGDLDAAAGTITNRVPSGGTRHIKQHLLKTLKVGSNKWRIYGGYENEIDVPIASGYTALFGGGQSVSIKAGTVNNTSPSAGSIPAGGAAASISPALQNPAAPDDAAADLTLPQSALYTIHREPGAKYLVETDPRFANYQNFVSSDFMLSQMGLDPAKTEKRLGDGFYEQKLVRDQITQLTGRQFLSGYSSTDDEYKALLTNGAAYANEFNLTVGVALTADQMAKLTSDLVWLVEKEVDGQKVLVPVVYLAPEHSALKPSGALIAADHVDIQARGDINNSGTIRAGDSLNLSAGQDIANLSGRLSGGQVTLTAGRDIRNETTTFTSTGKLTQITGIHQIAGIEATGGLTLNAGRDVSIQGGELAAGQNVDIAAGRNLEVGAVAQRDHLTPKSYERDNTLNLVSSIQGGGSVTLTAKQDANLAGAQVDAGGDLSLAAGGNVNLTAVKDRIVADTKVKISGGWRRTRTDDETVIGSTLHAGGQVTVAAVQQPGAADNTQTNRGNVTIEGSNIVSDSGAVALQADNDITVKGTTERHESLVHTHRHSSGFLSSTTTDIREYQAINQVVGSNVSGDQVDIRAGRDLTVAGSGVVATHDVTLAAGNDVHITAAEETSRYEYAKSKKKSGAFASGVGVTIGTQSQKRTLDNQAVTQVGSTIGSIDGNVNITAGKDMNLTGSDIISGKDTNITAQNITIDAATNSGETKETYKFKSSGLTVAVNSPAIDKITTIANKVERAREVEDNRLSALYEASAARNLEGLGKDIHDTLHGVPVVKDGKIVTDEKSGKEKKTSDITLNISLGSSSYQAESVNQTSEARGSTVTAGGDVNLTATGSGAKDGAGKAADGDITVIGSTVSGQNVTLDAAKDINLKGSDNTSVSKTTSGSQGAGVGVQLGKEGFGAYAEGSQSKGKENGTILTHTETVVEARDTLTLKSGGDTNLEGAKAKGGAVKAEAGGDVKLRSQQNIDDYQARSRSAGGRIGISNMPSTFTFNQSKMDSTYASVIDQTGIYAGQGGFDITVGGNTDIKGAVIGSEATPDKNTLNTGTLTWSDIQNHAEYSSSSFGLNINTDPNAEYNEHGITPNIGMPSGDNADSTTYSAISPGKIIVGGKEIDPQGLSRDTTNALNSLGKIFDKQTIGERQELAALFGELAFEQLHKISEQNGWEEGSPEKVALHGLIGVIMADLGGGNTFAGGFGAALNEALQKELDKLGKENPDLRQWASFIVGSAAGDTSGGVAAYYGTKYNDQSLGMSFATFIALWGASTIVTTQNGMKVLVNKSGEVLATWNETVGGWVDGAGNYIGKKWDDLVYWSKSEKALDNVLKDAEPGRETKGRASQYEKPGGYEKALEDFDSMNLNDVQPIPGGKMGKLPDGRTVNVRNNSSDGRPTLEVYDGKKSIKVRYND